MLSQRQDVICCGMASESDDALLDEAIEQLEPLELEEEMEGLTEEEKQLVMATFDRLWDRLGWPRGQLQ